MQPVIADWVVFDLLTRHLITPKHGREQLPADTVARYIQVPPAKLSSEAKFSEEAELVAQVAACYDDASLQVSVSGAHEPPVLFFCYFAAKKRSQQCPPPFDSKLALDGPGARVCVHRCCIKPINGS